MQSTPENTPLPLDRDELYTQFADVENELIHYRQHFCNRVVICNCNDPFESSFFQYFAINFNKLKLKKLIAVSTSSSPLKGTELPLFGSCEKLNRQASAIVLNEMQDLNQDGIIDLEDVKKYIINNCDTRLPLLHNGDFRSYECLDLLREADIAVTHPPQSLFREYVDLMFNLRKKFLLLGPVSAILYCDIFTKMQSGVLRSGSRGRHDFMEFRSPENIYKLLKVKDMCWYTNLI